MEKKLSDLLSALATKTKAVENKIENAREVTGKLLNQKIEESKTELQKKKNDFVSHAEAVNAKSQKGWDSFKKSIMQKAEHIKAEAKDKNKAFHKIIEENKQELSVEAAQRHYNNAVDYATFCIEWAAIALSEVESATLESFAAKQNFNKLKKHVSQV
jgi:t-SNARE complex subunit (syntaxin)